MIELENFKAILWFLLAQNELVPLSVYLGFFRANIAKGFSCALYFLIDFVPWYSVEGWIFIKFCIQIPPQTDNKNMRFIREDEETCNFVLENLYGFYVGFQNLEKSALRIYNCSPNGEILEKICFNSNNSI